MSYDVLQSVEKSNLQVKLILFLLRKIQVCHKSDAVRVRLVLDPRVNIYYAMYCKRP